MKQTLNVIHTESGHSQVKPEVSVEFECSKNFFTARFYVQSERSFVNPEFTFAEPAWGLWEADVVEIFVSAQTSKSISKTYYEFNLSPLNQYFELEILEPRVSVNKNYRSKFNHKTKIISEAEWSAEMNIPLESIGCSKEMIESREFQIIGNAFACLGPINSRSFLSLHTPKQEKPDFHLPKYFKKIF